MTATEVSALLYEAEFDRLMSTNNAAHKTHHTFEVSLHHPVKDF